MAAAQQCSVCGGGLRTRFPQVLDPQTRETFAILECPDCGLGHTWPQPEQLGPYYGSDYHGGRHGLTAQYCIWRRLRFLASQPQSSVHRLLDVGCGDGSFLMGAKGAGWEVAGTEFNPVLARERGLTIYDDLEQAAANGPYGCITTWHSLEHLRDPKASFAAMAKLLAPDGTLLVAVPDWSGLQANAFGASWFHLDVPRHLFHFSAESLRRLAEQNGLKAVKSWHTEAELDLFGWTQSALNLASREPNQLFSMVMGKPTQLSPTQKLAQLALGSVATLAALPIYSASVALRRGGIVVHAMQRQTQ